MFGMALLTSVLESKYTISIISIVIVVILLGVLAWCFRKEISNMGILRTLGFNYDPEKDLFYSRMNAWQRKFGYCRLYDVASPMINIIVDSEPIEFVYDNRKWLIELWKGQYGMTMGCEIGVYTSNLPEINLPGVFQGNFYNLTKKADFLDVSYVLKKNSEKIMSRSGRHWWLTGFKLGEFANPSELVMHAKIRLKNVEMCKIFVSALKKLGYTSENYSVYKKTVMIKFDKPFTAPVETNNELTARVAQDFNKMNCELYQQISGKFDNSVEKIKYIKKHEKELYRHILHSGKSKDLYNNFKLVKKCLKIPFFKFWR